jgi:KTSC domain
MNPVRILSTPVTSTLVARVSYDASQSILDLEFCDGAVYRYLDVPATVYDELLAADSKGTYFNRCIRTCFTCQRLTPAR